MTWETEGFKMIASKEGWPEDLSFAATDETMVRDVAQALESIGAKVQVWEKKTRPA